MLKPFQLITLLGASSLICHAPLVTAQDSFETTNDTQEAEKKETTSCEAASIIWIEPFQDCAAIIDEDNKPSERDLPEEKLELAQQFPEHLETSPPPLIEESLKNEEQASLETESIEDDELEVSMMTIQQQMEQASVEPGAVLFTPPPGWLLADPKILPPNVKAMVIGKGNLNYPPSINLGAESYAGTVKDYLKIVKTVNASKRAEWKDLGQIRTQGGNASLSQVDMKTEWGDVRLMHVIIKKGEILYVLTAAALKEEFPRFYPSFFSSMRSLRFNKDAFEMISSNKRRSQLQKIVQKMKMGWGQLEVTQLKNPEESLINRREQIFHSEAFQKEYWEPFQAALAKDYEEMGEIWKKHMINKIERELVSGEVTQKK